MSTGFLKKRIWTSALVVAAVCLIVGAAAYAWALGRTVEIDVSRTFVYLVDTSVNIEASAYTAQYAGGAGYLLSCGEQTYAALSVYLDEEDAEAAKTALLKTNGNADTVRITGGKLYLRKASQKRKAEKLKGAFQSLYGNIQVLEREIARLDGGATQQSSKRILGVLERNFSYLAKEYAETFSDFAKTCEDASAFLSRCCEGIVYAKELRYLQCELCVSYVKLSGEFSL